MSKTDADVRAELREAAFLGARMLKLFVKPILDPRDFEGEEVPDAEDRHRMMQASNVAIGAWAKTVETNAPPQETPDERKARLELLMRTPEVQAWLRANMPALLAEGAEK